jgi:Xaa-Pro dipeptidase
MKQSEEEIAAALTGTQAKAQTLFAEIESQGLIRPGAAETEINESIYALAGRMYGITRYWHKRIVRAGPNTLAPYDENPPNLTVAEDDIVFLDLGPVFEEWEADFGRTFVVGDDPTKRKLCRDIEEAFAKSKRYFQQHADLTASDLYGYAKQLAEQAGWEYGGPIAGHLIGVFPHGGSQETKSACMSIPTTTTGCGLQMLRAESGIGSWRFTSWTARDKLADSTKNC